MRQPKWEDDEYAKSGRWKCKDSSSGAHYWIVSGNEMKCKYCSQVRQVDYRSVYQIMKQRKNAN